MLNEGNPESRDDCFSWYTSTHTRVRIHKCHSELMLQLTQAYIKNDVLTAGPLSPAWCSLLLWASRYWLKGFCRDGPTLGTDLTYKAAKKKTSIIPLTHYLTEAGAVIPDELSSCWQLGLPNIPVTASEGHTVGALVLNLPPPQTRNWVNWVKQQLLNPPFILQCPL